MEWELHGGEGLMQKCPPSGGGEERGYGYFLELHNLRNVPYTWANKISQHNNSEFFLETYQVGVLLL